MMVVTHDMHTAGEPLRIVKSGFPKLEGTTILEKREYAKKHIDKYRQLIINEPRGHKDMYGAILVLEKKNANEIGVVFINNEGYSSMCGHAVIALGRYVIDYGLVKPSSPETELIFHCPCGPVKTYVQYINGVSGQVRFHSVPAFVYKLGAELNVPKLGVVKVDIAFGGAFYVVISDKDINLNLDSSPLLQIVETAALITDAVREQLTITHPESPELSSLYGTIVTDGKDKYSDGPSKNICVFADKQVDRSPTGSGVTARIALQVHKGEISLNEEKEFKSVIGTSFMGKAVKETKFGDFEAVIVEVSGRAHYTGAHTFYLEESDLLGVGFQLPR